MESKVVGTAHWAAFGFMDVNLETCEAPSSVEAAKGRARTGSLVVCSTQVCM